MLDFLPVSIIAAVGAKCFLAEKDATRENLF